MYNLKDLRAWQLFVLGKTFELMFFYYEYTNRTVILNFDDIYCDGTRPVVIFYGY